MLEKFQHSIELELRFPQVRPNSDYSDIELAELENVFVPSRKKGTTAIKIEFKPNTLQDIVS